MATSGKLTIVPSIKTLMAAAAATSGADTGSADTQPPMEIDEDTPAAAPDMPADVAHMDVEPEKPVVNAKYPGAKNDTIIMNYAPFGTDPNHNPIYVVFADDKPKLTNEIEYKLQEYIFSEETLEAVKRAPHTLRGDAAIARYKELKFPRLQNWHTDEMNLFLNIYFSEFVHEIDGVRFNITLALQDYKSEADIDFIACRPAGTFAGHIQDKIVKTCKRREYRDSQFGKFLSLKLNDMINDATDSRPINLTPLAAPNLKTMLYRHQLDNVNHMLNMIACPIKCHMHDKMVYEFGGYYHSADLKIITKDITVFRERILYGCMLADDVGIGKTVEALSFWDVYQHANPADLCLVIVPDHLLHHWIAEIVKHFGCEMLPNMRLINVAELIANPAILTAMNPAIVIIDEFHELYKDREPAGQKDTALEELNKKLNAALEAVSLYKARFKIGITATPFPNDYTMHKILEFLLCETTESLNTPDKEHAEYKKQVVSFQSGNERYIRDQIRHVFIRKLKDTLVDIAIPNVTITDMKVPQLPEERAYYLAKYAEARYNVDHHRSPAVDVLLKIACDAWLSVSDTDDTTVQVNPATFREQTLATMHREYATQDAYYKSVKKAMQKLKEKYDKHTSTMDEATYYHLLETRLQEAKSVLESKRTVLDRYMELTKDIDAIMAAVTRAPPTADTPEHERPSMELVCQICFTEYTEEGIAYFKKCGHYFCMSCYRTIAASTQSKMCPMCRSDHSRDGEILVIAHFNMGQIGSKMHAIRSIITNAKAADAGSKFIVFTQYDQYIKRIFRILSRFHLVIVTIDDLMERDITKLEFDIILLSSKRNASGLDLSMVNNIIITDPFENYTFSRAMERQVIGRAHRIGQVKPVNIYRLVTKDTVEETYYNM
jgi:SNF2 family DNA or RNA helicase